jgi:hypothetical protein
MNALQIITLRAPQWAADPRINNLINYAREITSCEAFGQSTEQAIALRVLHILALEAQRNGNPGAGSTSSGHGHAGQVTSETEGQLSKSFSSGSNASKRYGALSTTVYGQELIELIRANVFAPMTRMSDSGIQSLETPSWLWNPSR